jgi:hypothetical protein
VGKSRRQSENLLTVERRDTQLGRRPPQECADQEQLVDVLRARTLASGEPRVNLHVTRKRANVGDATVGDEDPECEAGICRRDDHAALCLPQAFEAGEEAHDVLERRQAIAQPRGVFEAAAFDEVTQARA